MHTITRSAAVLATVAGAAWTVKFAVITARDGSFDPLESYVFILGLLGQIAAAALIAWQLTRALSGLARAGAAAAATLGIAAAAIAVQAAVAALVAARYDGGNLGIEQEAGILAIGLVWLALGVTALWARVPVPTSSHRVAARPRV
jgi:hypothetical protein